MTRRVVAAVYFLLAVSFLSPPSALAWTDTRARSLSAHLQVDERGEALVAMVVQLQVRGGWLEGFEISDLDPDMRLVDTKQVWLVSEEGEKFEPRVRVRRGGRLQVSFKRRDAPRRGRYRLGFAYRTSLAHRSTRPVHGGRVRVAWTLPGWQAGLEDVRVTILTARGAQAEPADESVPARIQARALGGSTLIEYRRVHLPRTTPWELAFTLPDAVVAEGLRGAVAPVVEAGEQRSVVRDPLHGSVLGLALWVLGWLSAWQLRRCGRGRARVRTWVSYRALHVLLVPALAAAAGVLWVEHPPWSLLAMTALMLSSLQRVRPRQQLVSLGAWRAPTQRQWRALRMNLLRERLGVLPVGDITTVFGGAGLVAAVVGLALAPTVAWQLEGEPWALALSLSLPLWWTGSRTRLPASVERQLVMLRGVARELLVVGCSMRILWYADAAGGRAQPRLRLFQAAPYAGLRRLDVCVHGRGGLCLLMIAQAGSAVDRWLDGRSDERLLSPGAQRAAHRLVVGRELELELNAIFRHFAAESSRVFEASLPSHELDEGLAQAS